MSESYKIYASRDYVDERALPGGATENQYLVTDSEGNKVWADRLAYKKIEYELLASYEYPEHNGTDLDGYYQYNLPSNGNQMYEIGSDCKVVFDGVTYYLKWEGNPQYPRVGNTKYKAETSDDNGIDVPFCFTQGNTDGGHAWLGTEEPGEHTIELYDIKEIVKKFDPKFMPNEVPVMTTEETVIIGNQTVNLDEYGEVQLDGFTSFVLASYLNVTIDGEIYNIPYDFHDEYGVSYFADGVCGINFDIGNHRAFCWFNGYTGEHTLSISAMKQKIPAKNIAGVAPIDTDNGKILGVVNGEIELLETNSGSHSLSTEPAIIQEGMTTPETEYIKLMDNGTEEISKLGPYVTSQGYSALKESIWGIEQAASMAYQGETEIKPIREIANDAIKAKLPFANVKDYGAVGDGVADDTEAFWNAVNDNQYVYAPDGVYRITQPIVLWKNHSRFHCEGELVVEGEAAIKVFANSKDIYVRKIGTKTDYTGDGIVICPNEYPSYYNTIEIGTTGKLNRGIVFAPDGQGIAYTIVRFKEITANRGISFEPTAKSGSYINENTFYGGAISGGTPIYTIQNGAIDPYNGNKFENVAFEWCANGMDLRWFQNNHFNSCRFVKQENSWTTFVTLDENSYGNTFNYIGFVYLNQIVQPNQGYSPGNIFDGRILYDTGSGDIELGRRGIMIGQNMVIRPDDRYDSYSEFSGTTDLGSQPYAIEGHTYYLNATENELVFTVPRGYWYGSALYFDLNIVSASDIVNVVIRHPEGWLATITKPGLYRMECNAARGWCPRRIDGVNLVNITTNVYQTLGDELILDCN